MSLRIALVAGEASSDLLGAALVRDLKQRHPEAEFVGVAGPEMRAAGVTAWHDCEALAVMGLVEVLKHLPRLLRLRRDLRERLPPGGQTSSSASTPLTSTSVWRSG